jgi:hypothetical protein
VGGPNTCLYLTDYNSYLDPLEGMLQALSDEHGALQRLADDSNVLVTVVPDFPTTVASKCSHTGC